MDNPKIIKEMSGFICDCLLVGTLPGILIPAHFGNISELSKNDRIFIARCDSCGVFRSDADAAKWLSWIIGLPYFALFDDDGADSPYHCFFKMTMEEAAALKLHVTPMPAKTCLLCLAPR